MTKEQTVYEEMKKAGLITGSHASDLYVKFCPEASNIAAKHGRIGVLLTVFKNQISGEMNYELPFCFDPSWENNNIK